MIDLSKAMGNNNNEGNIYFIVISFLSQKCIQTYKIVVLKKE